jgi:hypothetical protein
MLATWEDVQQKVCRKCIDGDGQGNCRLPVDEDCALQANFSLIVSTIQSVQASDYDSHVTALRAAVCTSCIHEDAKGNCWKRNRLDCALDRYYPLVVDIIEYQQSLASPPH